MNLFLLGSQCIPSPASLVLGNPGGGMCITFLCKGNMKKNLTLSLNVFSFSVVCECVCVHVCACYVCTRMHVHVCVFVCCVLCVHTRVFVYPNSSSCFVAVCSEREAVSYASRIASIRFLYDFLSRSMNFPFQLTLP